MTLPLLARLAPGLLPDSVVACAGSQRITASVLHEAARQSVRGDGRPRRRLLTAAEPLAFLSALIAALADGDIAVIPPNFQPATLAALQTLPEPTPADVHQIELYTSGSSGEPKCVPKQLDQLLRECDVLEQCWGSQLGRAPVLSTVPVHHVYGLLFRLLWPLRAGRVWDNDVVSEPAGLMERLEALPGAILVSSPSQLSRLPELLRPEQVAGRLKAVFSSGGLLSSMDACRLQQAWQLPVLEVLGSTETGGMAWRDQQQDARWQALPTVFLDANAQGALRVQSPFLPPPGVWQTEDAVRFARDGRFELMGRLDRIVKIAEKRVSLDAMETLLRQHDWVQEAALAPVTLGGRAVLGGVLVPSQLAPLVRTELLSALKTHLLQHYDPVLLPRRWRLCKQLPYNERGKLVQADLVRLLQEPQ
ncbi:AMP-binding protein [Leeia aquatica]|uniref:Acyl-CoA synthetase n=1 Tax=Leeia aquatica TaxID=2725557 RepID=A0A847S8L6_9NEIS|nr:AMP-binding protein [Leeia aquatica]NLR76103.1 acyl-CoA synthetase [Leeia aquatica]